VADVTPASHRALISTAPRVAMTGVSVLVA